jgi:hypothetical protein
MSFAAHLERNSGRATPSFVALQMTLQRERKPGRMPLNESATLFRQTEPVLSFVADIDFWFCIVEENR